MTTNTNITLIKNIASSIVSESAIMCLINQLKEETRELNGPEISEEFRERYIAGYIEGYLLGFFMASIEIAERMKNGHYDNGFIAKVTNLNKDIIELLPNE